MWTPNNTSLSDIEITEDIIKNKLEKLNIKKGAGSDKIPNILLKSCCNELKIPLTIIFQHSIKTGLFPQQWKQAIITPIFKDGDKDNIKNYRPVSTINAIPKVFENIIADQITETFKQVIPQNQHGFMKGRSTTTNLLIYKEYILNSMEEGHQVDAIYTDFQKAFDRVQHTVLVKKLEAIGCHGKLLKWFYSYITNRTQSVKIQNKLSKSIKCLSGVAQGSNLSPILFLIFIADLPEIFQNSECLMFADDLKLYKSITKPDDQQALQEDLDKLLEWCNTNKLFLNPTKCKKITFYRTRQIIERNYNLNGVILKNVSEISDLGVIFESDMSFKSHTEHTIRKARRMLGFMIRQTMDFKNPELSKILYCSLVRSILEYGSQIWYPYQSTYKESLEKVQYKFVKHYVFKKGLRKEDNYIQCVVMCDLLTLNNRYVLNNILFIFKLIRNHVDCPPLLAQLQFRIPTKNTRQTELLFISFHKVNYASNGLSNLSALFNKWTDNLDIDLFSVSLNQIKIKLKQLLFGVAD